MATTQAVQAQIACNLCGAREATILSTRSRSGAPLRTVCCTGCGLVWSDPRPHEVRQFYESDYRLAYKDTFEPRPKHVLRAGRVALSRLERIAHLMRPGMKILDIGAGGGEFACLLASQGHQVRGIEPNRGYAAYARAQYGLDIVDGFVGDVALQEAQWDLITVWHVLEHTEDPGAVLGQLRRALAPGGMLVVEVPNVEATCQSPRSSFHEAHLYNFNRDTLHALAASQGLGVRGGGLSPDGGNLTAIFCAEGSAASACAGLPGNHDRVAAIVQAHTLWRYLLSPATWARSWRRLSGQWQERRWLAGQGVGRGAVKGRDLLQRLYRCGAGCLALAAVLLEAEALAAA